MNPIEQLDEIIRLAGIAKDAIADEHEGNLKDAVSVLTNTANALNIEIRGW